MSFTKFGRWSAGLTLCFAVSDLAAGFPAYLDNFSGHYEDNQVTVDELVDDQSCGICHVSPRGGGSRNAYGQDFEDITLADQAGFNGIESLDSDGDRFNNLEEIFLQTAPGNDSAVPAGRISLSIARGVLSLDDLEGCKGLNLIGFGFGFNPGESAEQGATLISFSEGNIPRELELTGDSGVILAKCAKPGLVGSVLIETEMD